MTGQHPVTLSLGPNKLVLSNSFGVFFVFFLSVLTFVQRRLLHDSDGCISVKKKPLFVYVL